MRILHLHSGNLFGGVETLLVALAKQTASYPDLKSTFALCFDGRLETELKAANAEVHLLGPVQMRNPLAVLRVRSRLKELLRRENFDLIATHSTWSLALFGPALRAMWRPKPVVFWLHHYASGKSWLDQLARRCQPDLVISVSRSTDATAAKLFPQIQTRICYSPVELKSQQLQWSDRCALRDELSTPHDSVVIIQVSRMEAWKGHLQLLLALQELLVMPNWTCWIVGGAQTPQERRYFERLQNTTQQLQLTRRVRFTGARSDVPRLLAAADVFCQPNTEPEPFGIVFVEALNSRLPVVTTAFGGAVEIVDASCGVLVAPDDQSQWANALRQLITNSELRLTLGSRGPQRAKALCDPLTQMRQLHEILTPLVRA
ncbi:MAG: glycosyltransferase family 4 protein [Verrucomicrobiota bacterium]